MKEPALTPSDLCDHPELAMIDLLAAVLAMTRLSLLAAYPDCCSPPEDQNGQSEEVAYVSALLFQVEALAATLRRLRESIQRAQARRFGCLHGD